MALGNDAYDVLQAEQQARAQRLAATPMTLPLQQRLQNSGILPMIGGGAMTAARGFDDFVLGGATGSMVNSGRNLLGGTNAHPTQTDFPVFPGALGKAGLVAGPLAKGAPKVLPALGARFAPMGAAAAGNLGQDTPPQPDALSGPAFAPASPAPMAQGALAAEAQQRATPATRIQETAPARAAMPPTPQQRQTAMAQAFASPDTLQAVAEAGTVPGGKSEPLKKKREGFSPENMGLIAFGLTLMGGGDISEAMDNGLMLHGTLDGMRDEKEQKAASEELLKNVPSEYVPALNALIASKQFDKVAEYGLGIQQDEAAAEAANAQRSGLVQQAAGVLGISADAISMMPADKLAQMVVNRFDTQDTMQVNAQKAQIEASKQAALQGDEGEARAYLAQFGVDAEMLSGKALEKEVTKFATGDFSSSQSETAGHAYIMATVLPRLDYLEQNFWQGDRMGFGTNSEARNEYNQLLEDLTLAINRKDSGAAVAKEEFAKTERLYGFQTDKFFGANKASNAQSQENRRTKLKAFAAQTGGAYQHMIINNPIAYGDDLTAAGVEIGADFFPTAYSTNPLGIELEGVE